MQCDRIGTIHIRAVCTVLLFLLLVGVFSSIPNKANASALDYSFALDAELVDVSIEKDGSIDINYQFNFTNYGQLDGVDIGLPNSNYDESTAMASVTVNGHTYAPAQIRKSPYIPIGLAVEFTSDTRAEIEVSGTAFVLNFSINNPHMVYENELVQG